MKEWNRRKKTVRRHSRLRPCSVPGTGRPRNCISTNLRLLYTLATHFSPLSTLLSFSLFLCMCSSFKKLLLLLTLAIAHYYYTTTTVSYDFTVPRSFAQHEPSSPWIPRAPQMCEWERWLRPRLFNISFFYFLLMIVLLFYQPDAIKSKLMDRCCNLCPRRVMATFLILSLFLL